ncbi:hypothetical protein BGZ79_003029, partial [Entomortierella chlamydospora]
MLAGLKKFLDDAHARDISPVSFMRVFSGISDEERILAIWTGEALPYLQSHSSLDKGEGRTYLRKFTAQECEAMVDKELADRDIESIAEGPPDVLKRSWRYQDLDKSKMALVQRPRGQK